MRPPKRMDSNMWRQWQEAATWQPSVRPVVVTSFELQLVMNSFRGMRLEWHSIWQTFYWQVLFQCRDLFPSGRRTNTPAVNPIDRLINKQKRNWIILGGKPTSWRESVDGCFSVAQQLSANKDNRIKSADGLDDPDFTFVTRLRLFSCWK